MGSISAVRRLLTSGFSALLLCLAGSASLTGQIVSPDYWHTDGSRILNSKDEPVRIAGVSWFGLETGTFAPHGLWVRNYRDMLDQIKQLGFNVVRLPYSNEMLLPGKRPTGIDYGRNPDLVDLSPLEIMDRVVAYAGKIGLRILLDRHRPDSNGQSELWYTSACPEECWISDWRKLATRYKGDSTVIGMDLHNEPRNPACWGCGETSLDWRLAAQRAGNAILEVNPNLLIVVEGVELYKNQNYWWGGNLAGVAEAPVMLQVAHRVVYSPHDYPSSIYPQAWFSHNQYPANLLGLWDSHWGFISRTGVAPILLGEFGTKLQTDSDRKWLATLTEYLKKTDMHWMFWSWNPNSEDTGGLLMNDWITVDKDKMQALKPILGFPTEGEEPQTGGETEPNQPEKPSEPAPPKEVVFCTAKFRIFSDWESGYAADLHILNEGAGPVEGWIVTWELPAEQTVREMWNARFTRVDNKVTVQDAGWNASLPEGSNAYFGFTIDYTGSQISPIANVTLNGFPCAISTN